MGTDKLEGETGKGERIYEQTTRAYTCTKESRREHKTYAEMAEGAMWDMPNKHGIRRLHNIKGRGRRRGGRLKGIRALQRQKPGRELGGSKSKGTRKSSTGCEKRKLKESKGKRGRKGREKGEG